MIMSPEYPSVFSPNAGEYRPENSKYEHFSRSVSNSNKTQLSFHSNTESNQVIVQD